MGYFLNVSQFVMKLVMGSYKNRESECDQCDEINDWTIVHLPLYLSLKVTLSYIIVLIYNDCVYETYSLCIIEK